MKYQRKGGYFIAETKSCSPKTTRAPQCGVVSVVIVSFFFGGAMCSGAHHPGFSPSPAYNRLYKGADAILSPMPYGRQGRAVGNLGRANAGMYHHSPMRPIGSVGNSASTIAIVYVCTAESMSRSSHAMVYLV